MLTLFKVCFITSMGRSKRGPGGSSANFTFECSAEFERTEVASVIQVKVAFNPSPTLLLDLALCVSIAVFLQARARWAGAWAAALLGQYNPEPRRPALFLPPLVLP